MQSIFESVDTLDLRAAELGEQLKKLCHIV
jgi:hypothetical protein